MIDVNQDSLGHGGGRIGYSDTECPQARVKVNLLLLFLRLKISNTIMCILLLRMLVKFGLKICKMDRKLLVYIML